MELCASNWTHLRATTEGSSSTPGRCRSSRVALGSFFHSSSSLFICVADICLALVCSLSDGTRTSQVRKVRSWINGSQLDGFLRYREENIRVQLDGYKEENIRVQLDGYREKNIRVLLDRYREKNIRVLLDGYREKNIRVLLDRYREKNIRVLLDRYREKNIRVLLDRYREKNIRVLLDRYREKNIRVLLDGYREKLCRGYCLDLTSGDTK